MTSHLKYSTRPSWVLAMFLLMATVAPNAGASLVGRWTFDEGSGLIAADSSGNGRTGSLLAAPGGSTPTWINDGVSGGALSFNGTGYVDFANTAADFNFGSSGFTIAAWARYATAPSPSDSLIVGKHNAGYANGYFIDVLQGNLTFFHNVEATRVVTPTIHNDNQWHFVVGVNNGVSGSLYVDGQYISSQPGTPLANGKDMTVGGVFYPNGVFGAGFVGSIDDVRAYNNALTQAEISQLYASTTVPVPAAAWLFGSALAGLIGFARRKRS